MDEDDMQAYATYSYSQEARENDAANERISPSKMKKRKNQMDPNRVGDPLVLTGNIGHFGVGAQHSTFFMGFREHIMSRAVDAKGCIFPYMCRRVCVCALAYRAFVSVYACLRPTKLIHATH